MTKPERLKLIKKVHLKRLRAKKKAWAEQLAKLNQAKVRKAYPAAKAKQKPKAKLKPAKVNLLV